MKILIMFVGLVWLAPFVVFGQSEPKLVDDHAAIVKNWLSRNPSYRLAAMNDYDPEIMRLARESEGSAYLPFYAVADMNHDGTKDFAVVFANRRRAGVYSAAIFHGPFNSRIKNPAFVVPNLKKGDGIGFKDRLLVGPYASDDIWIVTPVCRTYKIDYFTDLAEDPD